MSALTLSARLDRSDTSTPWGFRMTGGKDYNQALTIQRVTPGSLAAKCGLQVGDSITKIGGSPTSELKHKDAQMCIMQSGNSVELTLQRGGGLHRPPQPAMEPAYQPSEPTYSSPQSSWDPSHYPQSTYQSPQAQNQNYNTAPKPFTPGGSTMPVAVNKQYNTPINMYSVNNVMDSLATQTAGMNMGDEGTNVKKIEDSDVYKLVHEDESSSGGDSQHENETNSKVAIKLEPPMSPGDAPPPPINMSSFPVETPTKPPPNKKPEGLFSVKKFTPSPKSTPMQSARYEEQEGDVPTYKGYTNPSMQSRSFKLLKDMVDSGEDVSTLSVARKDSVLSTSPLSGQSPNSTLSGHSSNSPLSGRRLSNSPHLLGPTPYQPPAMKEISPARRASSPQTQITPKTGESSETSGQYVKAFMNNQYNSPLGLYAKDTATETFKDQSKILLEGNDASPGGISPLPSTNASESAFSNTVTESPRDTITISPERKTIVIPSPTKPANDTITVSSDRKKIYRPSETFRLVQEEEAKKDNHDSTDGSTLSVAAESVSGSSPARSSPLREAGLAPAKIQSRSFRMLEKQLDGGDVGAPAASSPRGPPSGQRGPPAPQAPRAPAGGQRGPGGPWAPKIPTGPRNMKLGRAGDARNIPAPTAGKIPVCNCCGTTIRGPFISALDKTWCPNHFNCANPHCQRPLIDCGFVEEDGQLFCEADYRTYLAPKCAKCGDSIIGDRVTALQAEYHPACFVCCQCGQPITGGQFHKEGKDVYCNKDWQAMFQTKCYGCDFPIEPGDRWVEALNQNWHSECFNCSSCQMNLEGQSFFAKGGKPYCKKHAMGKKF